MGKTIRIGIIVILILGAIGITMNMLFNDNTVVYITQHTVPNSSITWYEYDFNAYLNNLTTNIQDVSKLQLDLPPRHWDSSATIEAIGNNMALLVDYVILLINIGLYPLKVGAYLVNFILALLGLSIGAKSDLHWLEVFIRAVSTGVGYI